MPALSGGASGGTSRHLQKPHHDLQARYDLALRQGTGEIFLSVVVKCRSAFRELCSLFFFAHVFKCFSFWGRKSTFGAFELWRGGEWQASPGFSYWEIAITPFPTKRAINPLVEK